MWIFLIVGIASTLWHGFASYVTKLNRGYYKAQPSLPPASGTVKYEIGGYKFQIPISYHYTIYEMRGNRWIEKDPPVQKVKGGIIFDVFLPDFKSIGNDSFYIPKVFREKRVYVAMTTETHARPIEQVIEYYKQTPWYQDLNSYPEGLWGFYHSSAKETFYFQRDHKDAYFVMTCKITCGVDVIYKQYPTLKVHYFYDSKNLKDWSRINDGIRQKLDEFSVAQFN